jgi:chromosomal replication initiator protein
MELSGLLPGLQSRLMGGLAIPLQPPGPAARLTVLRQVARQRRLELSEPVVHLLAESLPVTVPELRGALIQLETTLKVERRRATSERVRKFLAQRGGTRQPDIDEVARAAADHFSLKLSELRSSSRRRALVTARGVAMYLARQVTGESLHRIGRYFGNRDHTTVMHGCRKTEELVKSDPAIREAVRRLQQRCRPEADSAGSRRRRA